MCEISNANLTEADLPAPNADWGTISTFALTFDGYGHWHPESKCAEIANATVGEFWATGQLPTTLSELRTCLFFEQRRYHHFGSPPDEKEMKYIRAIVEAIRWGIGQD